MALFDGRTRERTAATVYDAIVAQARGRGFFADCGVPDTMEGRFEMLVLLACLYFRRLRREDGRARRLGQAVFDAMFRDMDASLREIGIGDLTVPKKIKVMGEAFYGRASAYDAALAKPGDEALGAALARNIWPELADQDAAAMRLARWVRAAEAALGRQQAAELVTSGPAFPAPGPAAPESAR